MSGAEGWLKIRTCRISIVATPPTTPAEHQEVVALIMAAPDLLTAAKAVMHARLPQLNFDLDRSPDMQALGAAIAKAEGRG